MPTPSIVNPYGSNPTKLVRVQTWISAEDHAYLKSVCTTNGLLGFALATHFRTLVLLSKKHGLTFLDSDRIAQFIHALPTAVLAAAEGHFGNEPRGTQRVHHTTPPAADNPTDLPVSAGKRPGPGGRRAGKGNQGR